MEEELETVQPQINHEQQQADLEVMESVPDVSEEVPQSEPVAGLSAGIIRKVSKNIRKGIGLSDVDKYSNMADKYNFDTPIHVQKEKARKQAEMDKLEAEVKLEKEALVKKHQAIAEEEIGEPTTPFEFDINIDGKSFLAGEPKKTAESMLKDTALDPTNSWEMNYNTLAETNDIKSLIANQAEANKVEIDDARRGIVTDEALTVMSRIIGESPEKLSKILQREEGEVLSAEYVLASKDMLVSSSKRLYELATRVSEGKGGKADELALLKQQYFHKELYKSFMGLRAEFGRGLRAFNIKSGSKDFETEQISEALFNAKFGNNPKQLAELISNTDGDMKRIGELTKGSTFEVFMNKSLDAIHAYRIGSVLSGASTQIVNFTGGLFNLGLHQVDMINAGLMGALVKSDVPFDRITLTDTKANMFAFFNSIHDSLGVAFKSLKTGEEYGLGGKAEDLAHDDALKSENLFGVSKPNSITKAWDASMGVHQFMVKNVMSSTDSFIKKLGEQQELYRMAFARTEHIAQKENLTSDEAKNLLQYMIENPSEDMIRESTEIAKRVTFQESNPDVDSIIAKGFGNRLVRNVMLFRKTPTNILRQAYIDRNPAMAYFSKKVREDFAAGGSRRQMVLGRIATGAEITGMGYMMVSNGIVTGAEPKDAREREAWHQEGKKPYSIKIGDNWVSYAKLEPASNIIGIIATMSQEMQKASMYELDDEDEDRANRLFGAMMMAFGSQTLDKSMMTGLKDFMEAMTSERKASHFAKSLVASSVPFSGMQRNIKYLMDENARASDTVWEYIKAQTPYDFESLPKKRDFYGNPYKREQYLNPVKIFESKKTKDVVLRESDAILKATNKTFFKMPSRVKSGKKLLAREYSDYVELSRKTMQVKDGGNWYGFKDYLKLHINDDEFKTLSPETRLEKLSSAISKWDTTAYKIFIRNNEKLRNRFTLQAVSDKIYNDSFTKGISLQESKKVNMDYFKGQIEDDFDNDVSRKENLEWRIK